VKMKFNEYLSVLVYKLVLVINLINGKTLNEKDKNGKHALLCKVLVNRTDTDKLNVDNLKKAPDIHLKSRSHFPKFNLFISKSSSEKCSTSL
jgi:hypothetical protein